MKMNTLIVMIMALLGCAAFVQEIQTGKGSRMKEIQSGTWSPQLTDPEKETLFRIAEDTLKWRLSKERAQFDLAKYELTDKLKEKTATFVTLKNRGALRGCIGSLEPVDPLYISVHHNAVNASEDGRFRFNPVTLEELPELDVHISILSPIEEIRGAEEFKIGENGIIISRGFHRAVFLPEVAVEQGWTREETLDQLSMKAGMTKGAWRSDTKFKVFSSVVLMKRDED